MRISDWSSDVCSSDLRDQRQRGEIDRGERAQALGRQFGGAEIGDHAREIANPAIGVDRAGFFVAGVSEKAELHGVVPSIVMVGEWAGAALALAYLTPTLVCILPLFGPAAKTEQRPF